MLNSLLNIIFPPVCPLCENDIGQGGFCRGCAGCFERLKIQGPLCITCGVPFPSKDSADHTCGDCLKGKPPFVEARSGFIYSGSVLEALHSFKYNGRIILAGPLGGMMKNAPGFSRRPDIIIPVPLHKKRLRARGFNQSLLLAREVEKTLGIGVDYLNLKRVRETEQQVNLRSDERHKNVSGAFALGRPEDVIGKKTLLIDDVFTTGATVKECSWVLKKAGAEVFVLTFARALKL